MQTLRELAKEHEQLEAVQDPHARITNTKGEREIFSAAHAHADVVHGWSRYERIMGEPVTLSAEDYRAALDAKANEPHEPANMRLAIEAAREVT